jgi:hypothetical protein
MCNASEASARVSLGSRHAGTAYKVLHFLEADEAILIGVDSLEDAFVSSLELL